MKIEKMIELLPDDIKLNIIDFTDVKLKTGETAVRVTLDREFTAQELSQLKGKHFLSVGSVCYYRYAPELKHSYFYIV